MNEVNSKIKFIKVCGYASDLIPKSIYLKDRKDIAICDIEITEGKHYGFTKGLDKEITITVATATDNIIEGGNWNPNSGVDKLYKDTYVIDMSWDDKEIIKHLLLAREKGCEIAIQGNR